MIPDSVKPAFDFCTEYLEKAGVDSPAFEVSVLMEDLLGVPKGAYVTLPDGVFTEEQLSALRNAIIRRSEGYPLQYIIGSWDFYGRRFSVGEGVLIPRPETELLCDTVIDFLGKDSVPEIVDLCSGSGCIAITLAKEIPNARVAAVELYPAAFAFLEKNIALHKACVRAVCGDCNDAFGMSDCVVSNPPYVNETEMKALQKEVTFEPETALTDFGDGLSYYRAIAKKWFSHIKSGGLIAFEIGDTEGEAVLDILLEHGYKNPVLKKDYSGRDRVVFAVKE